MHIGRYSRAPSRYPVPICKVLSWNKFPDQEENELEFNIIKYRSNKAWSQTLADNLGEAAAISFAVWSLWWYGRRYIFVYWFLSCAKPSLPFSTLARRTVLLYSMRKIKHDWLNYIIFRPTDYPVAQHTKNQSKPCLLWFFNSLFYQKKWVVTQTILFPIIYMEKPNIWIFWPYLLSWITLTDRTLSFSGKRIAVL